MVAKVSLTFVLLFLHHFSGRKTRWKILRVTTFPFFRMFDKRVYASCSGKTAVGKAGEKSTQSRSHRAGLQFPVSRIHRYLKNGRYAQRIGNGAAGMSWGSSFSNRC
jgi:hypothetical protein